MARIIRHCPNCGQNLRADEAVERDGWRLTPGMAWLNGVPVKLTLGMAVILHTLATVAPAPVRHDVLANRSSRGIYSTSSLKVTICKMRQILGPLSPIETVFGFGYRWQVPAA